MISSDQTELENLIIYLDLINESLNKRDLTKVVESFIHEKLKKNPLSIFSVFYFTDADEPDNSADFSDPKELIKFIDENWKHREQKESYFENGLFYCLSTFASTCN